MSLFKNLSTANDTDIQEEKDVLGGGGVLDTDAYRFTIDMAYAMESSGGAMGVVLWLSTEDGRQFRPTLYVTSGREKGQKNYYEKDGKKAYLPGFNQMNAICQLTVDKELADVEPEEKTVKIYNFDSQSEVPTQVPVLTELLGEEIILGVRKEIVDKNAKNDATGRYEPTGETREVNEIDKVFCAKEGFEGYTITEIKAGVEEADFYPKWVEKNKGQVRDRSKGASGNGGQSGAPKKSGGAGSGNKPKSSLFGK